MSTKKHDAITMANNLIRRLRHIRSMRSFDHDMLSQYDAAKFGAIWDAFGTAPHNADGSLGMPHIKPTATHPINIHDPGLAQLDKALSADQLKEAMELLRKIHDLLDQNRTLLDQVGS